MPFEESKPVYQGQTEPDKDGKVLRLKRKPDGTCIFLDGRRCTIYAERPEECRAYPYYHTYSEERGVELVSSRHCPQLTQAEKPEIKPEVKSVHVSWWHEFMKACL